MRREPYEYALLRVVPRVDRGESLNAGVVLYSRAHDFLAVATCDDPVRWRMLDPSLDVDAVRDALASAAEGPAPDGIGARFRWLTAPRSTVVQPGPIHTGMTADPAAELERLRLALLPAATVAPEPAEQVRQAAIRVSSLARDGLAYTTNDFDRDRWVQLEAVAAGLFGLLADRPAADFALPLDADFGYVTPKVEIRGGIVDDHDRLLMMRERLDGRWSLPGGFADPLDTPSLAVVREVREETGYEAEAVKLVGCWDRDTQGHTPKFPIAMWKLFFLCRLTGGYAPPSELETLDVGWFGLDELPELSTGRVLPHELARIVAHAHDPSLPTEFD
ncbi:NUDIX hydrolase N-terminal domain-containing protein [Jatrophihabitans sp. YIM 134969]